MTNLLIIDNYDSFTYNLVHHFERLGTNIQVARHDNISINDIHKKNIHGIVISPGPGRPENGDINLEVVKHFEKKLPILGICLGMQVIGTYYGANIIRAKYPMHGKTSEIHHQQTGLFKAIPPVYTATRYHSLIIDPKSCPPQLNITAWTGTAHLPDEIMAISHTDFPIMGVQFHPESILTEHGHTLLDNFLSIVKQHQALTPMTKGHHHENSHI